MKCSKCGNDIENKSNKKQHWIKNTKLAQYCKENEKFRKFLCVVICIIIAILIIRSIVVLSNLMNDDWRIASGIMSTSQHTMNIIKLCALIIGAFILGHYGSKVVEKEEWEK